MAKSGYTITSSIEHLCQVDAERGTITVDGVGYDLGYVASVSKNPNVSDSNEPVCRVAMQSGAVEYTYRRNRITVRGNGTSRTYNGYARLKDAVAHVDEEWQEFGPNGYSGSTNQKPTAYEPVAPAARSKPTAWDKEDNAARQWDADISSLPEVSSTEEVNPWLPYPGDADGTGADWGGRATSGSSGVQLPRNQTTPRSISPLYNTPEKIYVLLDPSAFEIVNVQIRPSGKGYSYLADRGAYSANDLVVVPLGSGCRVVRVLDVRPITEDALNVGYSLKWVWCPARPNHDHVSQIDMGKSTIERLTAQLDIGQQLVRKTWPDQSGGESA